METPLRDDIEFKGPGECIRAARGNLKVVKSMLTRPAAPQVEQAVERLRDIEVQLSCAIVLLRDSPDARDPGLRAEIIELQRQLQFLRTLLHETERFFSDWLCRLLAGHTGYTTRGTAAPLFLVGKTCAEG